MLLPLAVPVDPIDRGSSDGLRSREHLAGAVSDSEPVLLTPGRRRAAATETSSTPAAPGGQGEHVAEDEGGTLSLAVTTSAGSPVSSSARRSGTGSSQRTPGGSGKSGASGSGDGGPSPDGNGRRDRRWCDASREMCRFNTTQLNNDDDEDYHEKTIYNDLG